MNKYLIKLSLSIFFLMVVVVSIAKELPVMIPNAYAEEYSITEFPLSSLANSLPSITRGPDGNVWFTQGGANKIGRITPSGTITEFNVPTENSYPYGITSGPDGNIWFTETAGRRIGRITPDGIITEFFLPMESNPYDIASGSDGNIWYANARTNKIGRLTLQGEITEFAIPLEIPLLSANIYNLTAGPDGNIWFAERITNKIGRITPEGVITQFTSPSTDSTPYGITAGPDGNIWYTEKGYYHDKIGRITPDGVITEFPLLYDKGPTQIISGPDGNLWFTQSSSGQIGRITPNGVVTDYSIPTKNSNPFGITSGADGNIWFTEYGSNKIGRVNLAAPSVTPSPTVTPTPSNVLADYKQTDPQWADDHLDDSLNCGDLYGYGCAVTSVADVFYSYGFTSLSDKILNPGTLNDWLSLPANDGYNQACSIYWTKASVAVGIGAPVIKFRNGAVNWIEGIQTIDNALNDGNLVILGINTIVNSEPSTHFLVVSSKLPDVNGKPDYRLVDPALYPFTSNNPGNTGKALSQVYGGFDKVFEYIIYQKDTSPQRTLSIGGHSPVQLLLTDPYGNQTGYDTVNNTIIENIPDSTYGFEPGIAPVDGSVPPLGETKYFQQIEPSDGEYTLELMGIGDGDYTLDFTKTDENGNTSTQVIKGVAQNGVTETYHIQYAADASAPPIVNKEVTFDVLKSDINTLYSQGEIKNKITYNILKLQVAFAEKTTLINKQPLGNKLAILALKTFQFELNKVRGKSITENAYQILYNDAKLLIESLQEGSGGSGPTPTPTPEGS